MSTLELIKEYISKHAVNPPENLTLESRLDGIGVESLAMLELLFEVEDKYGITLPNDAPMPETVGQLVELIEKYKPSAVSKKGATA